MDVLQKEFVAKRQLDNLDTTLKDAQKTQLDLQDVNTVNKATKAELDTLYTSIFKGPTPEFPVSVSNVQFNYLP